MSGHEQHIFLPGVHAGAEACAEEEVGELADSLGADGGVDELVKKPMM